MKQSLRVKGIVSAVGAAILVSHYSDAPQASAEPAAKSADLKRFNFDYSVRGSGDVAPSQVFDDGVKTYFQFPSIRQMPGITAYDSAGRTWHDRYRIEAPYAVVDRIASKYDLESGKERALVTNEAPGTGRTLLANASEAVRAGAPAPRLTGLPPGDTSVEPARDQKQDHGAADLQAEAELLYERAVRERNLEAQRTIAQALRLLDSHPADTESTRRQQATLSAAHESSVGAESSPQSPAPARGKHAATFSPPLLPSSDAQDHDVSFAAFDEGDPPSGKASLPKAVVEAGGVASSPHRPPKQQKSHTSAVRRPGTKQTSHAASPHASRTRQTASATAPRTSWAKHAVHTSARLSNGKKSSSTRVHGMAMQYAVHREAGSQAFPEVARSKAFSRHGLRLASTAQVQAPYRIGASAQQGTVDHSAPVLETGALEPIAVAAVEPPATKGVAARVGPTLALGAQAQLAMAQATRSAAVVRDAAIVPDAGAIPDAAVVQNTEQGATVAESKGFVLVVKESQKISEAVDAFLHAHEWSMEWENGTDFMVRRGYTIQGNSVADVLLAALSDYQLSAVLYKGNKVAAISGSDALYR
jgi:hypothetical protein